jgi:NitT/TauT family transport system substrate-binding protein
MTRNKQTRIFLLLTCALLCSSCKTSTPAETSVAGKVKLCYSFVSGTQLVVQYAKEKGIFAEHGLDVELIQINRGAKATAALIAGEVDVCQVAGVAAIHAVAAGEDVVLIGGLYNTHLYSLMVRPEIAGAADLKGKAVAISQPGSGSDSAMKKALLHLNLTPGKDVTLMMIGSQAERLASMESGQIAGTLVSVPETIKAREKGYRELLALPSLNIPYPSGSIATTRRFLRDHRPTALNLMKALSVTIARMKKDREGVFEVMAKYMKLDRKADSATLEEGYEQLVQHNLVDAPYPELAGIASEIKEAAADNPNAAKLAAEDIVDTSLVRELETTGFLGKLKK